MRRPIAKFASNPLPLAACFALLTFALLAPAA